MNRNIFIWFVAPVLVACASLLPSPDCNDNSLRNQMVMTFKQKEACKWI